MQLLCVYSRNPSKLYVKEFTFRNVQILPEKVNSLTYNVFLKAFDKRSGYRLAIIVEDLSMTASDF